MALLGISRGLLATKPKRTPREASKIESAFGLRTGALSARCVRYLLLPVVVRRRCAARPIVVCACGVIVAAARGVGEGVIGIVDGLEAFCAGCALWRVGGNAVGVMLQRSFLVGIADLLLGCFGVDIQDLVVVLRG